MLNVLKQLKIIIPKKEKKKLPIFLILSLATMLLETVGIAMIIPLISAIISNNIIYEYQITKEVISYFGNPSREYILIYIMVIISHHHY